MRINAIIVQTAAPDYRKGVYDLLSEEDTIDFKLYTGSSYFEPSVKTAINQKYCKPITNRFFFKRKFLFQLGVREPMMNADVLIIELNPRIISNWFVLLLRKVFLKKTILWGHAWPRKGMNSKSDTVRNIMRLLADEIIVYTKQQSIELQKKMPQKKIRFAPNAIYFKNQMGISKSFNKAFCNNIIYVGRLTKQKKGLLLVKAFHIGLAKLPKRTNLIIFGEGEEKKEIEKFINLNKMQNRIILFGHISDYSLLKKHYNSSLVSISPGYVGLSITQSLGFGVPMIISKNENHSPELEAANNHNSLFFETNNAEDLSQKLIQVFKAKDYWVDKRRQIAEECAQNYSIEQMSKTFIRAFNNE